MADWKTRTLWYLRGARKAGMIAIRVGSPKRDACGQTPWLFIAGEWRGQTVLVEPHKMRRGSRCKVDLEAVIEGA